MSSSTETTALDASTSNMTAELAIELAQRAYALRKYEEAVDHYATALESVTKKFGDEAPETADLYFLYGKALLENAINSSSVLGKEQEEEKDKDDQPSGSGTGKGPVLSFSGDAEDVEEDPAVDLFAQAAQSVAEADAAAGTNEDEEGEDEDAEPEDDFNAAWEVLDLARAIYDKQSSTDPEAELKLAETFIALGDISLETEKFDQAITDYEQGLALKTKLLPKSSRHITEAHYKLCIVLDMTSGRLADAISHAEAALQSLEARIAELKGSKAAAPTSAPEASAPSNKGKAKAASIDLVKRDDISNMTASQIENEIKDLSAIREDLQLKYEELKTSPNETLVESAPAMVAQALDKELNAAAGSSSASTKVNDLTSMVVKKKKKAPVVEEAASPSKRKAETNSEGESSEKKVKTDSAEATE